MTTENQTPDVFSMSAEEFAQFEGSLDSNGASDEAPELDSGTEQLNVDPTATASDEEEFIDVDGADDEIEEEVETDPDTQSDSESEGTDTDNESDDSTSDESETDFESEYRKLIGTPIKANGKDLVIDSMDDAIKLIQMGANYYKKVEQLKPAQKIIAMLESKDMLDESKLSFAIDLMNKNPQAIHKLISDMDLNEIIDDTKGEYKPTSYALSDQQIALDTVLKEIAETPTYGRTVEVIGKVWDNQSREMVRKNPQAISLINEHIASGIFDTVTAEVEKRKMLGTIPQGLSDIEVYKMVGDSLYANGKNTAPVQAQNGQQSFEPKANVVSPIKKPNKDTVVKQKKAASTPRSKPSVAAELENVYAMSSEEFEAKYGKFKR